MTSSRLRPFGVLALVLVTAVACASETPETSATPETAPSASPAVADSASPTAADRSPAATDPGAQTPVPEQWQFTTRTVADGEPFDAATLAGQDVILWFWAPWCPTCQAESGDLAAAAEELPESVTLMGVAGQSELVDMQSFVADFGVDNFAHMADVDGSIWATFGVSYQPAYALINDDGTIDTISGAMGKDGVLDAAARLAESQVAAWM